jgi:hypothetical protein
MIFSGPAVLPQLEAGTPFPITRVRGEPFHVSTVTPLVQGVEGWA